MSFGSTPWKTSSTSLNATCTVVILHRWLACLGEINYNETRWICKIVKLSRLRLVGASGATASSRFPTRCWKATSPNLRRSDLGCIDCDTVVSYKCNCWFISMLSSRSVKTISKYMHSNTHDQYHLNMIEWCYTIVEISSILSWNEINTNILVCIRINIITNIKL